MTIAERNNKLKHFITCLKCETSGKCCDDNCSTQYDAGNMGEIIENLEAISKVLEQEPRWIPVSERLPRKEGDYLVTVRNKEYGFQYIDITTYEHSEWGYKDEWQVIAWMNAPGEYKAESEVEDAND